MRWNVWDTHRKMWRSERSWGQRARAEERRNAMIQFDGFAPDALEVRKVLPTMELHGTKLMALKPGMIWDCAMADLERRERNLQRPLDEQEQYAFHRKHVAKAKSANDIIRAALADPDRGQQSDKRDTRLLYSDLDALKAALK